MTHDIFMQRCFDLSRLGAGSVSPNPLVGAVLVHEGRIIGEGWHRQYGKAHAEVNCLASVRPEDAGLVEKSTLYISLEPCCIHGNTPPCTDLVLRHRIPRVAISCLDQTPEVKGRGVEILRSAGVEVTTGILEEKGAALSAIRNTFVSQKRPYIQLKFAQSADGFMGTPGRQVWLSNAFSQRLAHKGRSEFDAILVGTRTALTDDPSLTNRLWFGKSPLRIVLDRRRLVPSSFHLFDGLSNTWVITEKMRPGDVPSDNLKFIELHLLEDLLRHLFEQRVSSLIVEGGAATLQRFIEKDWWDEAAIFTTLVRLGSGIPAPKPLGQEVVSYRLGTDSLTILRNSHGWPLNFV
ncbi:MAG: bifunctional diaminohydroxyphosphoribosylaminopyrimidine deaminase/5-amino-6-(5-phosphoribosylamino)uracil reductase RibD [Bacteroidetes bacterium]|nr:bifunctional diaminohydroxyphosphoribosylaminopyrimidine deaminase/5-amino-6-(5-phosphoribosylamino)uracil reductase RibD [Bacteroidota bacterium]